MKAILEFNLPEEEVEYRTHIDGHKYSYILYELDKELRSIVKYESPSILTDNKKPTEEQKVFADRLRSCLAQQCEEQGISLV